MSRHLQDAARAIFASALRAVDIRGAVQRRIALDRDTMTLAGRSIALAGVDRVLILAMGKAAVPMYMAAAESLRGLNCHGIVVGPVETLPLAAAGDAVSSADSRQAAVFLPGAHPTPTLASLQAAASILHALRQATSRTVVLFLVSGGASAMVEQPLDASITLHDLAAFSRALVGSGLQITQMNTLRKHLSAVKGGRLATAAAAAAMQSTLLISDVPAARPDVIASGPSLPATTTVEEARALFERLRLIRDLPGSVTRWFESNTLPALPAGSDPAFSRAHWDVVLSSQHLERAAVAAAEAMSFYTTVDNSCDEWDYRDASRYLLEQGLGCVPNTAPPTCLVSVGELAVSLPVKTGEGGRNQQFALFSAASLAAQGSRATVLSAGSDGIDGHSGAAGAVCDETTLARAEIAGCSVPEALATFNAAPLLRAVGDTLHTGPTGNNLRDLRLILREPS